MDKLKVLLIDDEEELVTALVERLEYRGVAADYALDGYAAMEKLRSGTYQAVVLDLKLPGMDGTEVLRRIVSEYPGVPVLMITGHGSALESVEPCPSGAFDCLMKPVKIEFLVQRIREAVGLK